MTRCSFQWAQTLKKKRKKREINSLFSAEGKKEKVHTHNKSEMTHLSESSTFKSLIAWLKAEEVLFISNQYSCNSSTDHPSLLVFT